MERRPDMGPTAAAAPVVGVALPERLRQVPPREKHLSQEQLRHQQQFRHHQQGEVRHPTLEERC